MKMWGDESEALAAQRPLWWLPAACLAFSLPDGIWALFVGCDEQRTWDGHQLPQWVFQRLHVMNVAEEDGGRWVGASFNAPLLSPSDTTIPH